MVGKAVVTKLPHSRNCPALPYLAEFPTLQKVSRRTVVHVFEERAPRLPRAWAWERASSLGTRHTVKMASVVQGKLKKLKPSAKNVVEKYKEVLDHALRDLKKPEDLRAGLETFVSAGKKSYRPP